MTDEISGQPTIPVAELEGLVKEWRASAHETRHKTVNQGKVLHFHADELERLIEEYTNDE